MKNPIRVSVLLILLIITSGVQSQDIIFPIEGQAEWQKLFLSSYKIDGQIQYYAYSSELDEVDPFEGGFGKYTILNIFDNNPATAWVEGVAGYGEGEMLFIGLGDEVPQKFVIRNGYQKSESIYRSNSRPKTVRLTLYTGFFLEGDVTDIASVYRIKEFTDPMTLLWRDMMGEQDISIGLNPDAADRIKEQVEEFKSVFSERIKEVKEYCPTCSDEPTFQYLVKIEIVDVYKGSRWDDTCISDFKAVYAKKKVQGIPLEDTIEDVYESDDMGSGIIFVDTDKERELILLDKSKMKENELADEETSFEVVLMDVSPDKEWAQVNIMFYQEGAGRVEEYSAIYHVRSLQREDDAILGVQYGIHGFVEQDNKLFLDTSEGMIELDVIKQKINSGK